MSSFNQNSVLNTPSNETNFRRHDSTHFQTQTQNPAISIDPPIEQETSYRVYLKHTPSAETIDRAALILNEKFNTPVEKSKKLFSRPAGPLTQALTKRQVKAVFLLFKALNIPVFVITENNHKHSRWVNQKVQYTETLQKTESVLPDYYQDSLEKKGFEHKLNADIKEYFAQGNLDSNNSTDTKRTARAPTLSALTFVFIFGAFLMFLVLLLYLN